MPSLTRLLLEKDLKRMVRNPMAVVILILIPFLITAVIGLTFGGMAGGNGEGFAPIRLGIVDKDDSVFSQFLSGAEGQEEFREHIDAQFLEEETAMEMIRDGDLSAVLIIPEGFTEDYLTGDDTVRLTLIKNPAEYIYPTFAQEGLNLIVTALNAVARNFREDLGALVDIAEEDRDFDFFRDVGDVIEIADRAVKRLEAADAYLNPPLVTYENEEREDEGDRGPGFSLFSFLLVGMAAMFILMIGDNCMRDLYREARFRTLDRFRSLREGLFVFIASKVVYTVAVLLITSVIILGGGSLIFKFQWHQLDKVAMLVICYSFFSAGLMGFIAALAGKERRADLFNSMLVIGMSLLGGCMWPVENLPEIFREHVAPYLPTYWFSSAVRGLQSDYAGMDWMWSAGLSIGLGVLLIGAAAAVFRIRLAKGIRE